MLTRIQKPVETKKSKKEANSATQEIISETHVYVLHKLEGMPLCVSFSISLF